jgi:hypothetical protein
MASVSATMKKWLGEEEKRGAHPVGFAAAGE